MEDIPSELIDADAQWEAIENPVPADLETSELLAEIDAEVKARAA